MADIVGEAVNSHGYQALTNGYEKAQQFIQASDAKGRVLAAMTDRNTKMEQVGLLNSQAAQFSSAHSVSVQLNSVSKQVISEMAKLPADVNIEIADKIVSTFKMVIGRKISPSPHGQYRPLFAITRPFLADKFWAHVKFCLAFPRYFCVSSSGTSSPSTRKGKMPFRKEFPRMSIMSLSERVTRWAQRRPQSASWS